MFSSECVQASTFALIPHTYAFVLRVGEDEVSTGMKQHTWNIVVVPAEYVQFPSLSMLKYTYCHDLVVVWLINRHGWDWLPDWFTSLITPTKARVRFPAIPGKKKVLGQPREYNWGATWYKSSGSCLESRGYGHRDQSRWPRGTLYPQKLPITSPTSGGRSVGIVRSRTQTIEFSFFFFYHKLQ
jgi:hypothetical protein